MTRSPDRSCHARQQPTLLIVLGGALAMGWVGCKDKQASSPRPTFGPKLSNKLLPADLQGLIIGKALEKDVKARFPEKSKVSRDKSLGGDMLVGHNDKPGVSLRFGPFEGVAGKGRFVSGQAMLVKDGDGPPRLHSFSLRVDPSKGGSVCDWVSKTFGSDKAAKSCEGTYAKHRRTKTKQTYCLGTPDGKCGVIVECAQRTGPKGPQERLSYRRSCRR